ncbi:hypothetical protein ACJX0J_042558, partial [Zea mays]
QREEDINDQDILTFGGLSWKKQYNWIGLIAFLKRLEGISTILEVGNIELFELNEVLASQFVYYCSKLGWIVPKNPDLPLSGTSDTVRQVISRFLRIMLFIWILSSTVLVQTGISLNTLGSLGYEMDYGWRRRIACSITLGQSSELEKLVVSSPKASTNPPNISLTAEGGSVFPVNDPIITITDIVSNPMAYCLAAMKSENFMSGLKVVFDRERKVLGWKNFD